jgi:prepilin-type N-terminal cleavage/methylation domain-containing protein
MNTQSKQSPRQNGFTLTELLICLGLLGLIATLTLPKVLQSYTNHQYNANMKAAVQQIAAAYSSFVLDNDRSPAVQFSNMTSYINFVAVDTVSVIDHKPGSSFRTCGSSSPCLKLHNGGILQYVQGASAGKTFNGTGETAALELFFDPDGRYSGTTNGPGKSVNLFLYYSGKITSRGNIYPNTTANSSVFASPDPGLDPDWLAW